MQSYRYIGPNYPNYLCSSRYISSFRFRNYFRVPGSIVACSFEKRDGSAEGRSSYANRTTAREESERWDGRCIGNAGMYGFNISSPFSPPFLSLARGRRITRRRRWVIFISLNSFHGRLASNARTGGKRWGGIPSALGMTSVRCAFVCTHREHNPPALDFLLYVRSNCSHCETSSL